MLKKCPACDGKKYVTHEGLGISFECSVCHGKGGFDISDNKDFCPECKGKGTIIVKITPGLGIETDCEKCFGTGFIDKVTE